MRILLIEDDEYKAKQIKDFLYSTFVNNIKFCVKRAFTSGMKELCETHYDLLLLDMSMHSFEETSLQSPGRHRSYGGRDIISEMKRKGIHLPVIVVTQFSIFGEGREQMNADELDNMLNEEYSDVYLGLVKYNASMSEWKDRLLDLIKRSEE